MSAPRWRPINPDPKKIHRITAVVFVIEFAILVYCASILPIKEKPYLLYILALATLVPTAFVIAKLTQSMYKCPKCNNVIKMMSGHICVSCGHDWKKPVHVPNDPETDLEQKTKSWTAPPELMVPLPRNVRFGALNPMNTLLRRLFFLGVCILTGFALYKNNASPIWIYGIIGLGVALMAWGIKCTRQFTRIVDFGALVGGLIVEAHQSKNRRWDHFYNVRYSYGGASYERTFSSKKLYSVGDMVTVIVDPESPSISVLYPEGG